MQLPQRIRPGDIGRPEYGKHAPFKPDAAPGPLKGKAAVRRMRMLTDARRLLDALPRPGEAVHFISTGNYDVAVFVTALLELGASKCDHLRVATLTFNMRNKVEMMSWLETGKVGRLTVLCSNFFHHHYREMFEEFADDLKDYPGSRIAHARSHCKVVVFSWESGEGMTLEGSSNLRSCHNWEQGVLVNDRELAAWHSAWIDSLVNYAT
jgi:hypothetical protein